MNVFDSQHEFVDNNSVEASGYKLGSGDFLYQRFSNYVSPEQVKGLKVLDIGSKLGAAGAYVLSNGASKYVGVDFDPVFVKASRENLKKYYDESKYEIILSDAETLMYHDKFDIVFVGRVLHQFKNSFLLLKTLSEIADSIVIEDLHPPQFILNYLLEKNNVDNLQELKHELEYNYPIHECHSVDVVNFLSNYPFGNSDTVISNPAHGSAYSIGFLRNIFRYWSFNLDLTGYEVMKKMYPNEYGLGKSNSLQECKKYIVKFNKNV